MRSSGRNTAADSERVSRASRFYIFKIPTGMVATAWFPMLARNHFAVSPSRLPLAVRLSIYALINSALAPAQQLIFGRRIAATALEPPIFIIGHWRTGTTWMHELLALDQKFVAPSTLDCFAPSQVLVFGPLLRKLAFLLPETRPMDNMQVGWDFPQEDEFALLNLGLGSPYETMIFPNRRPVRPEFLQLSAITAQQAAHWKSGLIRFFQQVTLRSNRRLAQPGGRRIVAKSPPHTARIGVLRELFPAAQFIHMVRNPYEMFASTVQLWQSLYETQAVQKPQFDALPDGHPSIEDFVFDSMDMLYRDFAGQISEIPPGQFSQVRYEDLVAAPAEQMRRIYADLNLGSFDAVRPALEAHLQERRTYQPNVHRLSPSQRAEVERRWRWYFERYGYQTSSAPHVQPAAVPARAPR